MPVAVVTGASRGIGRAIARALAGDGYELLLVARNKELLEDLAKAISSEGGRAEVCATDLAHEDASERVYEAFTVAYSRLDVLVNNAGIAASGAFGTYSLEDWDRVMNINARAPFFLTQRLLPLLKRADPGFVFNIGSVVSKKGYEQQSLYVASKHALLGFTKSLARETVNDNVRVHAILPGGVNTELVTGVRPDIDTTELISPDEIAAVVLNWLNMRGNAAIDEISVRRRTKTPWA